MRQRIMKIGISGAGHIGDNLTRLTALGDEVSVANSGGPERRRGGSAAPGVSSCPVPSVGLLVWERLSKRTPRWLALSTSWQFSLLTQIYTTRFSVMLLTAGGLAPPLDARRGPCPVVRAVSSAVSRDDVLDRLAEGIRQLITSEAWTSWLQVQSRFHAYSFGNTLLI